MGNEQAATKSRWEDPGDYVGIGLTCFVIGCICLVLGFVGLYVGDFLMQVYEDWSADYIIWQGLGPYGGMAFLAFVSSALGALGILAGLVSMVAVPFFVVLALRLQIRDRRGLRRAAGALGEMVDAGGAEQLIRALEDENTYVRVKAAEALGDMRDGGAVEPLTQALEDKDSIVRRSAVKALRNIGDARAVEPLIRALQDSDVVVQTEAAQALGELGDVRAIEPLVQALKDKGAAGGLFSPEAIAKALIRFGEQSVEPFIIVLEDNNSNAGTRRVAVLALEEIGDTRAVEPLVKALRDENGFVRKAAAQALGEIGDARAVEPLTRTLKDKEDAVKIAARKALKKIKASAPARAACPQCGNEVRPDQRFCMVCGAKLK